MSSALSGSPLSFRCVGRAQQPDIFFVAIQEVHDLRRTGDEPGERIEQIQRTDRAEMGEDGVDPDHSEHARAEKDEDHRHKALADAA